MGSLPALALAAVEMVEFLLLVLLAPPILAVVAVEAAIRKQAATAAQALSLSARSSLGLRRV